MLPPGKIKFFYSASDVQTNWPEYPFEYPVNPIIKNVQINNYEVKDVYIQKFNYFENEVNQNLLDENYVPQITMVKPRKDYTKYTPPHIKR